MGSLPSSINICMSKGFSGHFCVCKVNGSRFFDWFNMDINLSHVQKALFFRRIALVRLRCAVICSVIRMDRPFCFCDHRLVWFSFNLVARAQKKNETNLNQCPIQELSEAERKLLQEKYLNAGLIMDDMITQRLQKLEPEINKT